MTADEIQNLVDDPDAEEVERPDIGNREIDDLLDEPEEMVDQPEED